MCVDGFLDARPTLETLFVLFGRRYSSRYELYALLAVFVINMEMSFKKDLISTVRLSGDLSALVHTSLNLWHKQGFVGPLVFPKTSLTATRDP